MSQAQVIEVPGVGNVEFPAEMDDAAIAAAIGSGFKNPKTLAGFGENILKSGGRFLENIGSSGEKLLGAVDQALSHPGDTAHAIAGSHPLDAIGGYLKGRYGSPQKALDTAYEDPIGVASDISTVAGGVGAVGKVGALAKVPMAARVAKIGGAVADATNPLNVTKLPWVAARNIPPIDRALNARGTKLYEESLKIRPSIDRADRTAMVEEGLHGVKAPAGTGGLAKVNAAVQGIEDTVNPAIAQGAAQGMTVDPGRVAGRVDQVRPRFDTVNPEAATQTLDNSQAEFLRQHTTPPTRNHPAVVRAIPIDEAQRLKKNTYRKLSDSAYGEQGTAQIESEKALARGLKEEVYDQIRSLVPNIDELGPREKALIDLRDELERFANREGNKQTVPLASAASHSAPVALAIKFLDSNPALKSRIAIALANRGQDPGRFLRMTNALKAIGPPAATYGAAQQQNQQQQ